MTVSLGPPNSAAPQHRLYFFPDPHGQGSFRPIDIGGKGGKVEGRTQRGMRYTHPFLPTQCQRWLLRVSSCSLAL